MTHERTAEIRLAMGIVLSCAAWVAVILIGYSASAAPAPAEFNYQGRITDLVGSPVSDGPLDMTLALYDEPTGGSLVWEESLTVQVTDGIYHATLGENIALDLDFSQRFWLEIAVGNDVLDPRMPLHSVPYALHAEEAGSLGGHAPSDFLLSGDLTPAIDAHADDPDAHHDSLSAGLDIVPRSVAATQDISTSASVIAGQDVDVAGTLYAGDVISDNDVVAGSTSLRTHAHSHSSLSGVGASDHHSSTSNGLSITPATVSASGAVSSSSFSASGNISSGGTITATTDVKIGATSLKNHGHSHGSLSGAGASDHHSSTSNGLGITPSTVSASSYVAAGTAMYAGNDRRVYFHSTAHGNDDFIEFDDNTNYYSLRRDMSSWAHLAAGEVRAHHNTDYTWLYHNGSSSYGILGNSNGTGIRLNASGFHPWSNKSANLGSSGNKWDDVWADTCHCSAYIENNLMSAPQHDMDDDERQARFPEGSVLVWSGDGMELSSLAEDPWVQGVANDMGRPIVLGAELIRVIGPVQTGDFLVTSDVEGVATATPTYVPGTVIAQALDDHDGQDEGLIRAMIRKF